MAVELTWLGHAGFRMKGASMVVYVDPFHLCEKEPEPADLILCTHEHFDHFSPDDIKKILREDTVIVTTEKTVEEESGKLRDDDGRKIEVEYRVVFPGDKLNLKGVDIEAVYAYNVDPEKLKFHPKEVARVGFIVTIGGERIYHLGDTDVIPEMDDIKDIDVALVPVSGTYVMDCDQALEAIRRIAPKKAIPMHYGEIVGDIDMAKKFQLKADIDVQILQAARAG